MAQNFPDNPVLNDLVTVNGIVYKWNGFAWDITVDSSSGISLTDLSVGAEEAASGDGSLGYDNATGVFTYTPPDLSGYLTDLTGISINTLSDINFNSITLDASSGDGKVLAWDQTLEAFVPTGTVTANLRTNELGIQIGSLSSTDAYGVSIGRSAVSETYGIAIGMETQADTYDVTIGAFAGKNKQTIANSYTVGIGAFAQQNANPGDETGTGAVAIGVLAGDANQGENALALGRYAGRNNQASQSIVINATGSDLENATSNSCVVKPIRNESGTHSLEYNPTTGEITYDAHNALENVVEDTTPQLGGDLDVNGNSFVSISNSNILVAPDGTGVTEFRGNSGNDAAIQLNCETNGHGVKIKSPPHSSEASYTLTLPDDTGSSGQALTTDGTGQLSFSDVVVDPAGSDTQVQFNNSGSFGADANLIFNSSEQRVVVGSGGTGKFEASNFMGHADQTTYVSSKTTGSESTHFALNSTSEVTTDIYGFSTFQDNVCFKKQIQEKFSTINAATGTATHDLDNGQVFRHTSPSSDFTANFTNINLNGDHAMTITIIIEQGATAFIVSAIQVGGVAQTITWQGGIVPSGTDNGVDVISFSVLNTGTTGSPSYLAMGQLVDFT